MHRFVASLHDPPELHRRHESVSPRRTPHLLSPPVVGIRSIPGRGAVATGVHVSPGPAPDAPIEGGAGARSPEGAGGYEDVGLLRVDSRDDDPGDCELGESRALYGTGQSGSLANGWGGESERDAGGAGSCGGPDQTGSG